MKATHLGIAAASISLTSGCVEPTQRAVMAVPAARLDDNGRELRLLPPFELATSEDAIVRITGDVTCTGTLIADDLVLTAHHCVVARDAGGSPLDHDKRPQELTIELGGDYLPWGEAAVRAIVAPDCGYTSGDGDIAILVLSRHLIGVPTVPVRLETLPRKKEELRIFGFGRCALSRDAIHRVPRTSSPLHVVEAGHLIADAAICPGDSGGPVYGEKGEIIGIVSSSVMDGDETTLGVSYFTRVDVWPQIFSAAHEIAAGASPGELPPYGDCRPARARAPKR